MKIIPAGIDEERYGRLVFIRDALAAWRDHRSLGQWGLANLTASWLLIAVRQERAERFNRLRDRLLRDIRDPQEVLS